MATKAERQPLVEFAESERRTRGVPCWLCNIPERAEVEAAVANGVPKTVARRWLAEACGYGEAASRNRVDHHLHEHVAR